MAKYHGESLCWGEKEGGQGETFYVRVVILEAVELKVVFIYEWFWHAWLGPKTYGYRKHWESCKAVWEAETPWAMSQIQSIRWSLSSSNVRRRTRAEGGFAVAKPEVGAGPQGIGGKDRPREFDLPKGTIVRCGPLCHGKIWTENQKFWTVLKLLEKKVIYQNNHFSHDNYYSIVYCIVITRRFSEWRFGDWQNGGQILTYWWFSDFSFWKKRPKFFSTPHGFHLKTFPTPYGCQKGLTLPLTGFFYPWRELIFSLKKLFLTPNWLQIGKNGLNWPSFFYVT